MCFEQILYRIGIKRQHHLIRIVSIFHFSDFIGIPKDVLAIDNSRNLFKRKGIVLDSQSRNIFSFLPIAWMLNSSK